MKLRVARKVCNSYQRLYRQSTKRNAYQRMSRQLRKVKRQLGRWIAGEFRFFSASITIDNEEYPIHSVQVSMERR